MTPPSPAAAGLPAGTAPDPGFKPGGDAADLTAARDRIAQLEAALAALTARLEDSDREIADRFAETATLTRLLHEARTDDASPDDAPRTGDAPYKTTVPAGTDIAACLAGISPAARLAVDPAARHVIRQRLDRIRPAPPHSGLGGLIHRARMALRARRLRRAPGFDADWYLRHYPEVAQAGIDPALHYLHHGIYEGRDPGPDVDTVGYCVMAPDLLETGRNPVALALGHIRRRP